jgi:hypothetical protein
MESGAPSLFFRGRRGALEGAFSEKAKKAKFALAFFGENAILVV